MTTNNSDGELAAIEQLLSALEPLDRDARGRVIGYVFQRLGLAAPVSVGGGSPLHAPPSGVGEQAASVGGPTATGPHVLDVRTFATQKAPSSQLERTVVVAFYLAELAPPAERKAEITGADLTKYQKQAGLGAPTNTRGALFAARHAGYLDSAGRGKYKLNAVGYNLVAHSLPSSAGPVPTPATSPRRTTRRAGRRGSLRTSRSRKG